jgi:hypothetical protein
MSSDEWLAWRERWWQAWVAAHHSEPRCMVCAGPWSLRRDDLHHRSYDRLGAERYEDLIPLDRACHDRLHRILESTPTWQRVGREHATDVIVARLRRSTTPRGPE